MKERPILFSAPMVRAILDGSKTQTRRAVALPRTRDSFVVQDYGDGWWPYQSDDGESALCNDGNEHAYSCPYGRVGDRLWVKERHAYLDVVKSHMSRFPLGGGKFGSNIWNLTVEYSDGTENDNVSVEGEKPKQTRERGETRWRPSIHMPRWASRITLEITAVRVERLQDITQEDAVREGMALYEYLCGVRIRPIEQFESAWRNINGPDSWQANPWVWVIEFKRV